MLRLVCVASGLIVLCGDSKGHPGSLANARHRDRVLATRTHALLQGADEPAKHITLPRESARRDFFSGTDLVLSGRRQQGVKCEGGDLVMEVVVLTCPHQPRVALFVEDHGTPPRSPSTVTDFEDRRAE